METEFNSDETKRIREGINEKYKRVAISPEGNFSYPTGRAGLEGQKYDPEVLRVLPEDVLASFCRVGNPFNLGPINRGETVLDIGCGAGVDTFVAAVMVGSEGKVTGIDLTPDMLKQARINLEKTSLKNVSFEESSAKELAFPEKTFDVVISNGVFNLIPGERKTLREVFRVLKSSGRFLLADQILMGDMPANTESMVQNWARWQGGAIPGKVFLAMLNETGFVDVELVSETGFNSSPVTRGVLLRARKPTISNIRSFEMQLKDSLSKYQEFFNAAYAEGAIDRKTKHLIALGASLAAGCDPWTRYCLAVAREHGATDDELQETMAIAMTVGATKIKILQENALASLPDKKPEENKTGHGENGQGSYFTWSSTWCSGGAYNSFKSKSSASDMPQSSLFVGEVAGQ